MYKIQHTQLGNNSTKLREIELTLVGQGATLMDIQLALGNMADILEIDI